MRKTNYRPRRADARRNRSIAINAEGAGTIYAVGDCRIHAADGPAAADQPARVVIDPAYAGGPLRVAGYDHEVYVDLATLSGLGRPLPLLAGHDAGRPVGHAEAATDGRTLTAAGRLVTTPDAQQIRALAVEGFPWQASIGVRPGRVRTLRGPNETAEINGRVVRGPAILAYDSRLAEVSVVAIGSDAEARTAIAAEDPPTPPTPPAAPTPPTPPAAPTPSEPESVDAVFARIRADRARQTAIAAVADRALNDGADIVAVERLTRAALDARSTPQEFELALLRAATRPAGRFATGQVPSERMGDMVEAALMVATGSTASELEAEYPQEVLNAMDRHPLLRHGLSLQDLLLFTAEQNGRRDVSRRDVRGLLQAAFPPDVQAASGFSTYTLAGILGNVANKRIRQGFMAVEQAWREISAIGRVSNFYTHTTYSLTGDMQYKLVTPAGQIQSAEMSEVSYTIKADTYARLMAIPRTDIINDDLRALDQIPRRLGRGAALKLNDVFWTEFLDNSTFFAAGNNNYFEGAATLLQMSSLTTAEQKFMDQVDYDSKPLGIMPKVLLVATSNAAVAAQIFNSTEIRPAAQSSKAVEYISNPHAGKFRPVVSAYLGNSAYTGYSQVAWYLLADPMDLPVIETAFLNGREAPTVESTTADFDVLGIQMRGFHDFGVKKQEKKAGVKSKGAA